MSLLLERQIERLERAIELSSDWLEIQYLMAELDQLKDLYEEPDVEAAWSWRFVSTAFASFGCRYLFGKPSWLDCSRDPVALNLCRSRLIDCPVSSVINSFCRLFCVLGVLAFIWIILELTNADVDNRETCLKIDNSIDCLHRLCQRRYFLRTILLLWLTIGTPKQSCIEIHILVIYSIRASNALFFHPSLESWFFWTISIC